MATKLEDKIDPAALYDADFYAWAQQQAETLRRLEATHPTLPLDFAHLIEEVEDLARSDLRLVKSQLRRIIRHLLKLQHSPAPAPRRQWLNTIDQARAEVGDTLTATLRSKLGPEVEALYAIARKTAARDLLDHDEPKAAAFLPETCPYTLDQLLDETWRPTNRHGLVDPEL